MKARTSGVILFVWVLSCLPASARIEAHFELNEAIQKATHVVVLESGVGGFRVVESWAGDLAPGAVLDCLDLYCASQAQCKLIASRDRLPNPGTASSEVSRPVCVDGLAFVPEGARFLLFMREMRGDSAFSIPMTEVLPDRTRRFACVSSMRPSVVTSLLWIEEQKTYFFDSMMGGDEQYPEVLSSGAVGSDGKHEPMKLEELKALVASRQGKGEPAEQKASPAEEIAWRIKIRSLMKACTFKEVTLRLFRDGKIGANDYEKVTGQILGARVTWPAQAVPDGGVLLCVPDDQADPIVAKGLLDRVNLWTSKDHARLFDGRFSMESRMAAQVLDAVGAPIPNARVALTVQKGYGDSAGEPGPLCERTTDAEGRVQLLALDLGLDNGRREWRYALFNISCAKYGLAKVQYDPYVTNADGKIKTCLVREGSEARERALRGVVVDSKMQPVPGATVSSDSVRPSGLLITGYGATAVTDDQGRFCLYLPVRNWAGRSGKDTDLVPVRSKYFYQAFPPKGSGLRSASGWVSNSEPATISLEGEEAFAARSSSHTFAFEGGFPESTQPGGGTQVAVSGSDVEFGVNLQASGEEHQIPYGTYYARITSGKNAIHFEPIVVTPDSPKELSFRKIQSRCTGRVINGVTGKPIPGALCLAGSISWIPLRLSFDSLSDDLRKAMAAPNPDKGRIEQLAEPLSKDFPLMRAVVTDQDGRYEIAAPPGKEVGIVYAIAEGCVPAGRHVYSGNPSVDHHFDLDPIPLYPAGLAQVQVNDDTPNGQYGMIWLADEAATAGWAAPLKGHGDASRHSLELMVGRIEGGKHEGTFLLPAGVPLHIMFGPPSAELLPVRLADTVRVEPGRVTDLGDVRFAKAIKVPAVFRVVDAQGKPVEGVPIRRSGLSSWSFPTLTDADGYAQFDVIPSIVEKVGILSAGPDMIFAVTPDLSGSAKIEHTFTMSAEQLKSALGH